MGFTLYILVAIFFLMLALILFVQVLNCAITQTSLRNYLLAWLFLAIAYYMFILPVLALVIVLIIGIISGLFFYLRFNWNISNPGGLPPCDILGGFGTIPVDLCLWVTEFLNAWKELFCWCWPTTTAAVSTGSCKRRRPGCSIQVKVKKSRRLS
jgi:hypothetical protein